MDALTESAPLQCFLATLVRPRYMSMPAVPKNLGTGWGASGDLCAKQDNIKTDGLMFCKASLRYPSIVETRMIFT